MRKLKPPTPADIIRFLQKVKVDQESGCWVWQRHTDDKGYGQFKWRGRAYWAHRLAYIWFRGPIPDRIETDHCCTNNSCVCPWHFALKDKPQNASDRWKRVGVETGYGIGAKIELLEFTLEDLIAAEGETRIDSAGVVERTATAGPLAGCSCRMNGATCCFIPAEK